MKEGEKPIIQNTVSYPEWVTVLFLRFTVVYKGLWTHSLEDEKMLKLTKLEWFNALKDLPVDVIHETIDKVIRTKRTPHGKMDTPPTPAEFLDEANLIWRLKKETIEMEKKLIEKKPDFTKGKGWETFQDWVADFRKRNGIAKNDIIGRGKIEKSA